MLIYSINLSENHLSSRNSASVKKKKKIKFKYAIDTLKNLLHTMEIKPMN